MSFNKNCNNQSGIQADTVQANVTLITPNLSLPTTNDYLNTLTSNNIGYTINGAPSTNNIIYYNSGNIASVYYVTLPIGIWLISGQIDFYSTNTTIIQSSQIITQLSDVGYNNNFYNKNITTSNFDINNSIINQVSGIYKITSNNTIVHLMGTITFTTGTPISKIVNVTTTATTTTATTSSTSFNLTAPNSLIELGMTISGGSIVGSPIVIFWSGTSISMSTAQSISASTVLTFTLTKGSSFLTATRIG
jgi:hypothetical protein